MQAEAKNRKGATPTPNRKLRICEIYASVQGEGLLTGTPSTFIRTSGCNLRCWFCDTPFASWDPEGGYLTVEQVRQQCLDLKSDYIVLTGGEPMIHKALPGLCDQLKETKSHLTISMMRIVPPQQGQGSRRVSGMTSASDVFSSACSERGVPSRVRAFAILALRCAEASKP